MTNNNNENDNSNNNIILKFDPNYTSNTQYKLIQLDSQLLPIFEALSTDYSDNKDLIIKGNNTDEEAILCTPSGTFSMKSVQTSNSTLIVDQISDTGIIRCNMENYLELTKVPPKLNKIKKLLVNSVYKGPNFEEFVDKNYLVTSEELEDSVQASNFQIYEYLKEIRAIEYNGYWRLISHDYLEQILIIILTSISAYNINSNEINIMELVPQLDGYLVDLKFIEHTLICFTRSKSRLLDGITRRLNERSISKFFGIGWKKWNPTEFLLSWNEKCPDWITPELDDISGYYYYDLNPALNTSEEGHINYLDKDDLPQNPKLRIQHLFKLQAKWTLKTLKSYLKDAVIEGELNSFILMNCRTVPNPKLEEKQYLISKLKF
ncbi:hypothetical protein CONCODRAFT_80350 [Conidiobolus coronatus NRRL 28638]|uniref:Sister chromatid cohesion protein DCC1 n=1 Tax=Conidiobolus coronatus (strain ATCC 28846 / CBS 209.66 / NRRL 28638) TaxID=796925 RepID=A0A137NVX7_CONC2|nr:hypothetical protein CONCODRAFT_80350 [Conidiobolus coronatus NRRL 28638]|eukprot:KXN66917.1 hypothetical protein CONCODRAFT_80350 [Conidiobolus coronatus NRRL 28638]